MRTRAIFGGMALVLAAAPLAAQQAQQGAAEQPAGQTAAGQQDAVAQPITDPQAIIGKTVHTNAGNELGKVAAVAVSQQGELVAAVIDVGGDLKQMGVEQSRIMLSGDQLGIAPVSNEVVATVALSELEVAPQFLERFNEQATKPAREPETPNQRAGETR